MKTFQRKSRSARKRGLVMFTALTCAVLGLTPGTSVEQTTPEDWKVDPIRGPVDMGLSDPSLIGAIDVHLHVDPDAPGTGGVIRAIDVFDAAKIAMARGMRGFVFKTHQDAGSAGVIRKIGAEHLIVSTDCGQTNNVYPTDCLVLAARALRAEGVTQRELDLMYKINPAKLLGLAPPEDAVMTPRPVPR